MPLSIDVYHSFPPHVTQVLEQTIEGYPAGRDIVVNLKKIEGNYQQAFNNVVEGKVGALEDHIVCVIGPEYVVSQVAKAADKGYIVDIRNYIAPERAQDISETAQNAFGSYGLPLNSSIPGMFANATVLKAVGCEFPRTVEDIEKIAQIIFKQRDRLVSEGLLDEDFGIYTCAWPAAYVVEIPMAIQEMPLATPDNGLSGSGRYELKSALPLLLTLREHVREGLFVYGDQKGVLSEKMFLDKKVVFFQQGLTHASRLEGLVREKGFEMESGAAPLPKGLEGRAHAVPLGGSALWVVNSTAVHTYANNLSRFLNYLASDVTMSKWHTDLGAMPVLTSTYDRLKAEGFYQDHPIHRAVVQQTLEALHGEFSKGIHMPNWSQARGEIFNIIEQAVARDEKENFKLSDEELAEVLKAFDLRYSS